MTKINSQGYFLNNSMQVAKLVRENLTDFEPYEINEAMLIQLEADVDLHRNLTSDRFSSTRFDAEGINNASVRSSILKRYDYLALLIDLSGVESDIKKNKSRFAKLTNADLAKAMVTYLADIEAAIEFAALLPKLSDAISQLRADLQLFSNRIAMKKVLRADRNKANRERKLLFFGILLTTTKLCKIGKYLYRKADPYKYELFIQFGSKAKPEPVADPATKAAA